MPHQPHNSSVRLPRPRQGLTAVLLALLLTQFATVANTTEFPLERTTETGRYRVSLAPVDGTIPIAEIHRWVMRLQTAAGDSFTPTRLVIDAGMPNHGHGMASEARVTQRLDDDRFLIDGMKFHMAGEWELFVGVGGPAGQDSAVMRFEVATGVANVEPSIENWSTAELAVMRSLTIAELQIKQDPSNRFSGNPAAANLGKQLFFDKDMSADGNVSCATCHDPDLAFTDGRATSFGTAATNRNSPTLIGVSHNAWYYWDGRRDSLWAQAITPPESPGEMDNNRTDVVRLIATKYASEYEAVTGQPLSPHLKSLPTDAGPFSNDGGKRAWNRMSTADRTAVNATYANTGKFLAAYIETLEPEPARFDAFVEALKNEGYPAAKELLSAEEQHGLKLFLDGARTQCLRCHNGPLLTNYNFHNIATAINKDGIPDFGRMIGVQAAQMDPFNCLGDYSDAKRDECVELRHAQGSHDSSGAFKTPSLRNLSLTAPYMHDGRFATLEDVVEFYTEVPVATAGQHELPPLDLSSQEKRDLAAFLNAL